MELSFFIEEVWLASCPSPLSIFLSPPRFLLPGSPSSILPYTRRPSLLQRGNTFHNISTLCCQYCIFLYDIPDWSMNIWFSPSDSFVTNFDVSLNCHNFHISAFSWRGEIFLLWKLLPGNITTKTCQESIMFSYKVKIELEKNIQKVNHYSYFFWK